MKKPTLKSELNVMLLIRVTSADLRQHKYVIYLHKCANGIYVGESVDMVLRWKEHNEAAFNPEHRDYNQKFKNYIRNYGFEHFIVATANFEASAQDIEADAIQFYKAELNTKPEHGSGTNFSKFKDINLQLSAPQYIVKQKNQASHCISRSRS